MDQSDEQTSFQMQDPAMETLSISTTRCAVTKLLEDSGNCLPSIDQELSIHLLSDPLVSLFSEQQKLRDVLHYANTFLCSGSEIGRELCSTDSLTADGAKKISSKQSSALKYHHPASCDVLQSKDGPSLNTMWQSRPLNDLSSFCRHKAKFSYDLHNPFSFSPGIDEQPWPDIRETENMKSTEPQHATNEQTSSQDYHRANGLRMPNQRHHTFTSDRSTNVAFALDTATHLIKETTPCGSSVICKKSTGSGEVSSLKPSFESNESSYKRAGGEEEVSENQKVQRKAAEQVEESEKRESEDDRMEGKYKKEQESCSDHRHSQISHTEPEMIPEQTAHSCHMKLPLNVSVYEQYQLCVAQLKHLRRRQNQHVMPESPENDEETSEKTGYCVKASACPGSPFKLNSHFTKPEIKKQVNNTQSKRVTGRTHKIPAKQRNAKSCNNTTIKKAGGRHSCEKSLISAAHFDLTGKKHPDFMEKIAEHRTSPEPDVHCVETNAASNPGMEITYKCSATSQSMCHGPGFLDP